MFGRVMVEVEVTREIDVEVPVTVEVVLEATREIPVTVEVERQVEVTREVPATVEVTRVVEVPQDIDSTWYDYNQAIGDYDTDGDGLTSLGEICKLFEFEQLSPEAHMIMMFTRIDLARDDDLEDSFTRDWTNREFCDELNE